MIELWEGPRRLWRYRFLHPEGTVVWSNRGFATRAEAEQAASLAYPGVPVALLPAQPDGGPRHHPLRTLAVVSVLAAVTGVVAIGVAKAAVFARRSRHRLQRAGDWIRIATDLQRRDGRDR